MNYTWEYLPEEDCYLARHIIYCEHPQNPGLQAMHIYVPACYMNRDGSIWGEAVCNPRPGVYYTAATVPVILYNDIGGYSECVPAELMDRNTQFVRDGFVLVSVGARGRQTLSPQGQATGKAPAALVDLKAAVRYLRSHRELIPGDMEKIISVGTSAGGAISALLAATGNAACFDPALQEIGARMTVRDDIYAAQCYCPITDLDHADLAYEWMFGGKTISTRNSKTLPQVMQDFQLELGQRLAKAYVPYINSLGLGQTLEEGGRSGSFYTGLMEQVSASVTKFLQRNRAQADKLVGELNAGTDMIAWDGERAVISDLDLYVRNYIGRMKPCTAFDGLNLDTHENQVFGTPETLWQHFAATTARIATELAAERPDLVPECCRGWDISPQMQTRVTEFNPLHYILSDQKQSDVAPHVRIRLGSRDADTSFAISYTLYLALKSMGVDADYALVWGVGHCNADYPGELTDWVDHL